VAEERRSVEVGGKDIEEAITTGLSLLGVERGQVEIEVLSRGSRGILGLGAAEARVRLTVIRPPAPPAEAQIAQEVLESLLVKMGLEATVERQQGDGFSIALDIRGRDLGILIGRRGQTLQALEYITRLIVNRKFQRRVFLTVDVGGYKARRESTLRNLAERMATRVSQTQQPITLEPMPAYERRIVHLALRERSDVTTESVGDDENRKVVILPKT